MSSTHMYTSTHMYMCIFTSTHMYVPTFAVGGASPSTMQHATAKLSNRMEKS